jgi:hypothetical protein
MTGSTPGAVSNDINDQTADAQAVAQLALRERQSRDRGWWDDMVSCFTPGAVIDMSWFTGPASEFVRLTRERSANGVWGRHRLSPPVVRVIGDRAWAELPLGIEFRITVNGVEADLVSYARSQYRAERRDGEWRIARITSIYERDTLTPAIPGTALGLDPADFAEFRPSYRNLAWYFNQAGTPLGDDLLGDDRPGKVAHHYETERAWLLARLRSPRDEQSRMRLSASYGSMALATSHYAVFLQAVTVRRARRPVNPSACFGGGVDVFAAERVSDLARGL